MFKTFSIIPQLYFPTGSNFHNRHKRFYIKSCQPWQNYLGNPVWVHMYNKNHIVNQSLHSKIYSKFLCSPALQNVTKLGDRLVIRYSLRAAFCNAHGHCCKVSIDFSRYCIPNRLYFLENSFLVVWAVGSIFELWVSSQLVSLASLVINWIQYHNSCLGFLLFRLNSFDVLLVEQFFIDWKAYLTDFPTFQL